MKNIRFSGCIFPHDRLMSRWRPHCQLDGELVRAGCKALSVPGGHAGIRYYCLSGLLINPLFNVEGPEEFRDRVEKIPIRQVDPGA